jgi:hypothetical protein
LVSTSAIPYQKVYFLHSTDKKWLKLPVFLMFASQVVGGLISAL